MESGKKAVRSSRQPGDQPVRPRPSPLVASLPRGLVASPRAFTLVEMLVSLAVLSLALTVIGVVFAVATKTTRQAAAYAEANNWTRQFLEQIDEDLKYCEPSQSCLVLVGRTQAAALTKDNLDAGKFYRVLIGDPGSVNYSTYSPEYSPNLDPNGAYSNPRADILMFFTNRPTASQAPPRSTIRSSTPARRRPATIGRPTTPMPATSSRPSTVRICPIA
jgi:prepilin-type N-terminal cleavage/methylation domain-containing protein